MYLQHEKFIQRMMEFQQRRYSTLKPIPFFLAMEGELEKDEIYTEKPDEIIGMELRIGDHFPGRDRYLWIQAEIQVPPFIDGYRPIGIFDFGDSDAGCNFGFESMLWVNDEIYQAVDSNHKEVFLDQFSGQAVTLTFLLWTGLGGKEPDRIFDHRVNQAHIGYLHTETDDYYYLFRSGCETMPLLSDSDPAYYAVANAMDSSLAYINFNQECFYRTISKALTCLRDGFQAAKEKHPVTVHCVGHTHIDVAWLWRLKHTREKAQRSFASVLRWMDEYDHYYFLQTQPQLYAYLQHDNPKLYEKIQKRIQEKRWEADGGMWLEADCNLSSGEALTRHFLYGMGYFQEELGRKCEYLWLPDVFGYSWALPQILKLCGIRTFMTTKLSWNQYNEMPNDLFRWRGIDGSEVLTYFITTPRPNGIDKRSTYNGVLNPHAVVGSWQKFHNKDLTTDVLIAYGYGDGGGGVNRDMLMMEQAMEQTPGLPNVVTGRADDFFRLTHERAIKAGERLAVWDGELYLEYHRGTYTTQAYNKKMNRALEFALTRTEWLACLAMQNGAVYPAEELKTCWIAILRNQFHDIIPGSSIREVYEDSRKEYEQTAHMLDKITQILIPSLVRPAEDTYTVFNPTNFERNDPVWVPEIREGNFRDIVTDRSLLSQRGSDGYWLQAVVGALSSANIQFCPGKVYAKKAPFTLDIKENTLKTPHFNIVWNDNGFLSSIYDVSHEREILNSSGNVLEVFEDKPLNYDAWDIDIYYTQKCETAKLISVDSGQIGELLASVLFQWKYNKSVIKQEMVVYHDSRRIDFITSVDWQEEHRLLKTAFDLNIRTTKATYDIQYGYAERPTHHNTSWDAARFEVVGHKWADMSEADYGISLLNDCKYGYSARDNTLKLSLLRSSQMPDKQADIGEHHFTYSLLPHSSGVAQSETIAQSHILNQPHVLAAGEGNHAGKSIVQISSNAVVIDAVKLSEDGDGYIIRLHECKGGTQKVNLTSSYLIKEYTFCNLLENNETEWKLGTQITLTLKPFQISTIRLRFVNH